MKKRIFAVITVMVVLAIAIVPAFADEGQQLGKTTVSYTNNLQEILGKNWTPSQDTQQWLFQNPYTIIIDMNRVKQELDLDMFNVSFYVQFKQYYGGNLEEATPSSILESQWMAELDYDQMPNVYWKVGLQYEEISIPDDEWSQTFSNRYLLIPCFWFKNNSYSNDGNNFMSGPNAPIQIFNNSQWQGAINGNAYDNSITAQTSYNNGFREGREEGYEAGYNNGLSEGRVADAGIELITKAVETPFNVLTQWLNFEVLGVNVLGLVMSLLAICIVVIIIKAVMK